METKRRPNQRVGRFDQLPPDEAKALLDELNNLCDERKDGPFIPVTLDEL